MEDLHLGIIGGPRFAVRAEREQQSSSLSRFPSATQILVGKCPCSLIRDDEAPKAYKPTGRFAHSLSFSLLFFDIFDS